MKWRRGEKRSERKARENRGGVSLYFRDDLVYFVPQRLTADGWRVFSRPIAHKPASASPETLGAAALEAIESSRGMIETPSDAAALARDIVGELGFPSLAAFERGARCVPLHEEDGQIGVAPSKGTNRGFTFSKPRFSPPSPAELGVAILDALALSETSPPLKR